MTALRRVGCQCLAQGAILMITDIAEFGERCAAMPSGEIKAAGLDSDEPELQVSLEAADSLGHVRAQEITPDHLLQAHRFEFEVDQSYFPDIIRECSEIVRE